jgi:hypothetical protein
VAFGCAALALLAGALPAGAAQSASTAKTVTATVRISTVRAASPLAARPAIAASAQCAPGINEYTRSDSCWEDLGTITFFVNNKPVGSEEFTLEQSIHLKAASKDWTENDTVLNVTPVGEVPGVVDVNLVASCGLPCRAAAHFGGVLKAGLRGTVSYSDSIANGKYHETETSYELEFSAAGFVSGPPPEWTSGLKYRCDQGVAVSGTGCVYPEYTPTLALSHKQYGAAAYLVAFAQQLMTKHWGYQPDNGAPLTRASSRQGTKNRGKICNSTFHSMGTAIGTPFDRDSCDEFPFAATWQSGAQLGAVGQDCVQLKAVHNTTKGNEATQWSTAKVIGTPNYHAACVRGHIPSKENSAVGGAYGAFIKTQRLFLSTATTTTDKFWVLVTV